MSSFIEFQEVHGRSKSGWAVVNKRRGDPLGVIAWYSGWRDYVLRPLVGVELSGGCLMEIVAFMEALKIKEKAKR